MFNLIPPTEDLHTEDIISKSNKIKVCICDKKFVADPYDLISYDIVQDTNYDLNVGTVVFSACRYGQQTLYFATITKIINENPKKYELYYHCDQDRSIETIDKIIKIRIGMKIPYPGGNIILAKIENNFELCSVVTDKGERMKIDLKYVKPPFGWLYETKMKESKIKENKIKENLHEEILNLTHTTSFIIIDFINL